MTDRDNAGKPEQCVEFRNISTNLAMSVTFSFAYNNPHGIALVTQSTAFTGTFTPPFDSGYKCTDVHLGRNNVTDILGVDIHVLSVTYAAAAPWQSGDGFVRAYTNNGDKLPQTETIPSYMAYGPFALPSTSLPTLAVAQNWADAGKTPIEIVHSNTAYPDGSGMPWQCVNFRNVSDKVATQITFGFSFTDGSSTALASQQYDAFGTFTPPAEIDNKNCVSFYAGSPDNLARITHVDMHVLSVVFKDGTQWLPGTTFVHQYDATGARLAPKR